MLGQGWGMAAAVRVRKNGVWGEAEPPATGGGLGEGERWACRARWRRLPVGRGSRGSLTPRSGVLLVVPRGGPPPILKPHRGRRLRPGASPGGTPGPAYTRAAAGLGHALYSMVLVSGRPLRVDVRTCQNSSIFSILQCFTPVALVSHNSAQPDTSFVHFDP